MISSGNAPKQFRQLKGPTHIHMHTVAFSHLLVRSVEVVTSISLWGRYGWKADSGVEVDGSPENRSGDCVPVELALVPSPPTCGSCSSNTATNYRANVRATERKE